MKINKQSSSYTVVYIIVMVVMVGVALAFTATSLKPLQQANANIDKMSQILASVNIYPDTKETIREFDRVITAQYIVSPDGMAKEGDAFVIDVAEEVKKTEDVRSLPMYECTLDDGSRKFIIPLAGNGLWGPIWGYISVDADGSTVYGAYFAHQGETPGLGAEIEKPVFSGQFKGLRLFVDNVFNPLSVVKKGQTPADGSDFVDGISGGTITSKGVNDMLHNCLEPYAKFLENLKSRAGSENIK